MTKRRRSSLLVAYALSVFVAASTGIALSVMYVTFTTSGGS